MTTLDSSSDSFDFTWLSNDSSALSSDDLLPSSPPPLRSGNEHPLLLVDGKSEERAEPALGSGPARIPTKASTTPHSPLPLRLKASVQPERRRYRRSKVIKGRKYACSDLSCQWTFTTKRDRDRHVNSMHSSLRQTCPQCEKELDSREDNLKRHMKSHCLRAKRSNS